MYQVLCAGFLAILTLGGCCGYRPLRQASPIGQSLVGQPIYCAAASDPVAIYPISEYPETVLYSQSWSEGAACGSCYEYSKAPRLTAETMSANAQDQIDTLGADVANLKNRTTVVEDNLQEIDRRVLTLEQTKN